MCMCVCVCVCVCEWERERERERERESADRACPGEQWLIKYLNEPETPPPLDTTNVIPAPPFSLTHIL